MTEGNSANISKENNLIIGSITGTWLFLFLFLIKPFKQDKLDKLELFYIAISMSLITILCYIITISILNNTYKKYNNQYIKRETTVLFVFFILAFVGSFTIYKSSIANGSYNLLTFFLRDYSPTVSILLPITFMLRKYFINLSKKNVKKNFIYIYGENKLDYLKICKKDLISMSSHQNYVEISFLNNHQLQKKLIRSSLKKIHSDFPFLIKTHRSHLINPIHFISFKNQKILTLTMKEIPFSNKYKKNIFFVPNNVV